MTRRHPGLVLTGVVLVAIALGAGVLFLGRPQLRALARPAGATEVTVRVAGNDLLAENAIPVGRAPVCTAAASIVCLGTTSDGRPIRVQGPSTPSPDGQLTITVAIGGRILTADAQQVVDRAGSPP